MTRTHLVVARYMNKIVLIGAFLGMSIIPSIAHGYNSYCVQSALREREQGIIGLLQERDTRFVVGRQQLLDNLLTAAGQLTVSARAQSRIDAWNRYLTDMRKSQESYTIGNTAFFETYRVAVARCDVTGELFE